MARPGKNDYVVVVVVVVVASVQGAEANPDSVAQQTYKAGKGILKPDAGAERQSLPVLFTSAGHTFDCGHLCPLCPFVSIGLCH